MHSIRIVALATLVVGLSACAAPLRPAAVAGEDSTARDVSPNVTIVANPGAFFDDPWRRDDGDYIDQSRMASIPNHLARWAQLGVYWHRYETDQKGWDLGSDARSK